MKERKLTLLEKYQQVYDLHKKVVDVIDSCLFLEQKQAAAEYALGFVKKFVREFGLKHMYINGKYKNPWFIIKNICTGQYKEKRKLESYINLIGDIFTEHIGMLDDLIPLEEKEGIGFVSSDKDIRSKCLRIKKDIEEWEEEKEKRKDPLYKKK